MTLTWQFDVDNHFYDLYAIIVVGGLPDDEINSLLVYSSIPSASVMKILMSCSGPKHFKVSYKKKYFVYCDMFVCFVSNDLLRNLCLIVLEQDSSISSGDTIPLPNKQRWASRS